MDRSAEHEQNFYEVSDKDRGSAFLDLGFLIKDETSCLKGSLSDAKDVDFYNFSIPFSRTVQNYFGVEVRLDMPAGCDYSLTLYDEYGNQVGKALPSVQVSSCNSMFFRSFPSKKAFVSFIDIKNIGLLLKAAPHAAP